jgi:hypothetical protein
MPLTFRDRFRWAQCQLDALQRLKDRRFNSVVSTLHQMPQDLNSTYAQIMSSLESSDEWDLIARIIVLVAYSARPPTIPETAEFVIIENDSDIIEPNNRFDNCRDILNLASCFISVDKETLKLSHKSVKEFLDSQIEPETMLAKHLSHETRPGVRISRTPFLPESYIARKCLRYLSLPATPIRQLSFPEDIKHPNSKHLETLLREFPFLEYAATQWSYHIRNEKEQSLAEDDMHLVLLSKGCNLWYSWLLLQRADIWETQLSLAQTLSEAIISSANVGGWASNFWRKRQDYRVAAENHDQHASSCAISIKHPGKLICLSGRVYLDMAVVLLEVAVQRPLYESLLSRIDAAMSLPDLEKVIESLKKLSEGTIRRMGLGYHLAVAACLDHVYPQYNLGSIPDRDPLEDNAVQEILGPLQSLAVSGFRASKFAATFRSNQDTLSKRGKSSRTSYHSKGFHPPGLIEQIAGRTATSLAMSQLNTFSSLSVSDRLGGSDPYKPGAYPTNPHFHDW